MDQCPQKIKKRIMRAAIAALKKTHPGIVFDPTEQNKNINWISTGSAKLDMAISTQGGGLPRGRIVEVYGANSCGKTTQFILACANAQRQYPDQPVLYIDVEHSLNIEYAQQLGLDTHPDKWILVQPDSAEEALDILVKNVRDWFVLCNCTRLNCWFDFRKAMGEGCRRGNHGYCC